jgi:hypothetical protein
MTARQFIFAAFLWSVALQAAMGQEFVGIHPSGTVYRVDPRSGQTTLIGLAGPSGFFWTALGQDSNGILYAAYGRFDHPYEIHRIDPVTGQATFVAQTTLIGVSSLAFWPNDELLLMNDPGAPGSLGYHLVRLDLATGAETVLGNSGLITITALDCDESGRLWAYDYERGIVEIDPLTGAATDVNPGFRGPPDPPKSMVFGEDGALYLLDGAVWIGDVTTGVPGFVNWTSQPVLFSGMEYLPGPVPPFTLRTLGETGGPMGMRVAGATPDSAIVLLTAQGGGGPTAVPSGEPCAGVLLDLNATMHPLRVLRAGPLGRAQFGPAFVPAGAAVTTRLQALDLAACAASNPVRLVF